MNLPRLSGCSVLLLCLMVGGSAQAFVGSLVVGLGEMNEEVGRIKTPFAAEAKFETEEMKGVAHIFYKPGKVRDDMEMGGQKMSMIRRFDLHKFWMIMGQGMYMEVDPERGSKQAPQYKLISRERVGRETVNGIPTTKYKSVYESSDGRFGGFTWFTDDNIAVKGFMVSKSNGKKQRFKFEITRLDRRSQPDSLFEIPAGYRKFNMGGMPGMGMVPQGGTAPGYPAPAGNTGSSANKEQGYVEEYANDAQKTTEDTVKNETMRELRNSIRKGMDSLFGR